LQDNGFFIPFTFDFSGKSKHGKPAQLIIFGNPKIGTPLMQNRQSIGLDLPQKFLVWEDEEGLTHVTFNDPKFLGKRHGLQGMDTLLSNIANRLKTLANKASGNEFVESSNLHQLTSDSLNMEIERVELDLISITIPYVPDPVPVHTPVTPTTTLVNTTISTGSRTPLVPGTQTNSQSNSGTRIINTVTPSINKSPKEILKDATDRAQRNADKAANNAEKKAKKAK